MIGIISAMQDETVLLKSKMASPSVRTISGIDFVSGVIGGKDTVVSVCGIGKVCAAVCAQTMILEYSPEIIVNTGVGGNLSDFLKIGSVVVGDSVVQHDMDASPLNVEPGFLIGVDMKFIPCDKKAVALMHSITKELGLASAVGRIATGDVFVSSQEKKRQLRSDFGALVCEMEGGSIGQVCAMNGVPFLVVRAISDDADDNSQFDFLEFLRHASENSEKAVELFVSRYAK